MMTAYLVATLVQDAGTLRVDRVDCYSEPSPSKTAGVVHAVILSYKAVDYSTAKDLLDSAVKHMAPHSGAWREVDERWER